MRPGLLLPALFLATIDHLNLPEKLRSRVEVVYYEAGR